MSNNVMNTIKDDKGLLEMMMKDMESAPELFKPTQYWKYHEKINIERLEKSDLSQFRNIAVKRTAGFGASVYGDWPFNPENIEKMNPVVRMAGRVVNKVSKYINTLYLFNPLTVHSIYRKLRKIQKQLEDLAYYCATLIDRDGTLNKIEDSGFGNPTDIVIVNGKKYTNNFLKFFSQYVYVKNFVDFDRIERVLEIGSGYGGQAELLLKAHPHLKICIVDIPPQLYIAEQYLAACFKDQVYGYRQSSGNKDIGANIFEKYRIIVLAPWQLDDVRNMSFDLFWNSASFQEMEPDVVENYAKYIQRLVTKWLHLKNLPEGSKIIPGREKNVKEQTRLEHYIKFFSEFELIDRCPAKVLPTVTSAMDHMMFRRKHLSRQVNEPN